MSIESLPGPGEDDGIGGVTTFSGHGQLMLCSTSKISSPRPLKVPNKFEANSDRRGVGSCGLWQFSTIFHQCYVSDVGIPLVNMKVLR